MKVTQRDRGLAFENSQSSRGMYLEQAMLDVVGTSKEVKGYNLG